MRRHLIFPVMLIVSAGVFGHAQANTAASTASTIGAGDVLQIKVFRTPDLDTQARVDNAGTVTMPLIGAVHVAGMTPDQAGKEISQTYAKGNYIKGLGVSVMVTENASQRVSVLGQVKTPGSIPITPHTHLLDVISAAGGLDPTSSGVVSVTHRNGSSPQTFRVSGPLAGIENPEIEPGDTIQAEKAGIVYVVGAVNHAGGFVLENGKTVTLLQAIALAEGTTNTAKLKQARLIRTENGTRTMIPVDVKSLLRNKTPDQKMLPDDILFIPNSQVKEMLRASGQGAIDMAAAVSIYHI